MPVNPLAAGVPAPDIAAVVAGELAALAADAHTLGAQLSTGDVVEAIVLPSNGLTDLLDIGGLRVAAELPPSLLPGDTISVAVTGFSGDRINLQIVSSSRSFASESKPATDLRDAAAPLSASALRRAAVRPAGTAPAPPVARMRTANGPVSLSAPPGIQTPVPSAGAPAPAARTPARSPTPVPAPVAGPPRPAARAPVPAAEAVAQAAGAPEQTPGARVPAARSPMPAAGGAPTAGAIAPARQAPIVAAGAPGQGAGAPPGEPAEPPAPAAEALSRAAATLARAAGAPAPAAAAPAWVSEAPARATAMLAGAAETPEPAAETPGVPEPAGGAPAPAAGAALRAAVVQPVEARLAAAHVFAAAIARPPAEAAASVDGAKTAPNRSGQLPPSLASPDGPRPVIEVRTPVLPPPVPASATAAAPALRVLAGFTEPIAFLRALRLPVTSANVTSARMALAPGRLPNALATLERVLANNTDPRVATLSTLTSFLARLDPRSPVLATQIAAFVEHVVTGVEAKIAQLLRASDTAASAAERTIVAPAASREPPPAAQSANPPPLAPQGVAVARAALDFDLKTQLLALAANREGAAAATPKAAAFNAAIAGALTAITALQLNAAATLDANPGGLSFTLPVALSDGVAQARVRIDPDTPDGKRTPLDGDNFHIAFVLETRHLGTVAIDVMTVGRAVTLSVKTEGAPAQRVFGTALGELTARLEKLRYRVAKADAVVAPVAEATESPSRPTPADDPARLVDVNA